MSLLPDAVDFRDARISLRVSRLGFGRLVRLSVVQPLARDAPDRAGGPLRIINPERDPV